MSIQKKFVFRIIVPAFPELNIYSYSKNAGSVVSVGAVMIATMVNMMPGWRAEIIDENNYNGPRGKDGMPDHKTLQRENYADVVGFYCGLSSTIERVWALAEFYKKSGAKTVAGGLHASNCPQETLGHNTDVVVHGRGESTIRCVLNSFLGQVPLQILDGVSFLWNGSLVTNQQKALCCQDLDNLPSPNFALQRFGKPKVYPIYRIDGCGMRCEFCSVKHAAVWASPRHLFETVVELVETQNARKFFLVDDRMEEDMEGSMEFFRLIAQKYGNKLQFFVQTRMRTAENLKLIEAMKAAGVRTVFIGCESPIDEDLAAMRKGYNSQKMLEWVKTLRKYFWVHGMFIFGYPAKEKTSDLSAKEMYIRFWKFISKARFDSIQVLKPIPLVGSELRKRLDREGRLFPQSLVPWSKYDGNSLCFIPDNMTIEEMHKYSMLLMTNFYSPTRLVWVILRTILFPLDYLVRGWTIGLSMGWLGHWNSWHKRWFARWHKGWYKDLVKVVGHTILAKWKQKHAQSGIQKKLEAYCVEKRSS